MKIDITKLPQNEAGEWLIKTRDGRQAFIRTDKANPPYGIHGRIGDERNATWTYKGEAAKDYTGPSDLIMPEPWKLGRSVNGFTLAEGQEWHRQDFTETMLPEGWRPLIKGEHETAGDNACFSDGEFLIIKNDITLPENMHTPRRTRRPLPEAIDPYAELKKAHADGKVLQYKYHGGGAWTDYDRTGTPSFNSEYHEWRIKPSPAMVPLGPDDVRCGDEVRAILGCQNRRGILEVHPEGVQLFGGFVHFDDLQKQCTINRNDGKGWVRCEKEAK